MRVHSILAAAVGFFLVGCGQEFESSGASSDPVESARVDCEQTDAEFFEEAVWPVLALCTSCHQPGGSAPIEGARFVLEPSSTSDSLEAVRDFVMLAGDRLVHKPTEFQVDHGGGRFFDTDSEDARTLAEAVLRFGPDVPQCTADETVKSDASGYNDVNLISQTRTLRKASLLLAGELPDAASLDAVQANEAALRSALRGLMSGPVFDDWLKNSANDHLLARKYLTGMTEAQEALGGAHYEGLYDRTEEAFDASEQARLACESSGDPSSVACRNAQELQQTAGIIYRETQRALAEEPLELIRHVVSSNRPYSEVLTADYRMMNPFTYEVLDGETWTAPYDDMDPTDWRPGQVRQYRIHWNASLTEATGRRELPSAGILSSPIFQLRFPSTETNRNRARARWTYKFFLGVDIERLAVRAMDPEELQTVTNPGAEGSSCFGCHSIMDPVAGAFQNWGDSGHYLVRDGIDALPQTYVDTDEYQMGDRWYRGQLAPGFGTEVMPTVSPYGPANGYDDGLTWLAERIVADPRFAEGTVKFWFQGVFGRDPLLQPLENSDADFSDKLLAWQTEQTLISGWADDFRSNNYDLKALLVEMMMSPLFRAETFAAVDSGRQKALDTLGIGRLLSPEQLSRKFTATTGYTWKLDWQDESQLLENFYMFYGGIDSDGITERPQSLNSLMTSVSMRLANEMSCGIVLNEFWPGVSPKLFADASITTDPNTPAGEAVIRDTVRNLIWRFWGVTDPVEVDAAWSLYKALYDQRMALPENDRPNYLEITTRWSGARAGEEEYCGVRDLNPDDRIAVETDWNDVDWSTPDTVRENLGSVYNPEQTLRPWVGVLVYLLTDIQFLTE